MYCQTIQKRPHFVYSCAGEPRGEGGYFSKFLVAVFSTRKKIGPSRIQGLAKMRGQKDLKSMKKGVNWIENQDEN